MARIVGILGSALCIAFFVVWFGPKSGEGFTRGWGEAMVMYLIMAVQLLCALVLAGRLAYRRYRYNEGFSGTAGFALVVCTVPLAWIVLFNLLRDR